MGVVVDEYGESDLGELVADVGQRLGQPEGTELTDTEHFAISGLPIQRPSMSSAHARSSTAAAALVAFRDRVVSEDYLTLRRWSVTHCA
ncbi:hypothetical protein GCM10027176_52190 [Actinoallomurus bryophytorum]